jgi:hypothetical protein
MKQIILLIISLSFVLNLTAQKEYKVLMVKPSTVFINENPLAIGDVFTEDDKVTFSDAVDFIKVCFNDCSKTKILTGMNFQKSNATTLKDYFIATKGLAARGEFQNSCTTVEMIKKYGNFGILGEFGICLDTLIFNPNGVNHFDLYFRDDVNVSFYEVFDWNDILALDQAIFDSIYHTMHSDSYNLQIKYQSEKDDDEFSIISGIEIKYINLNVITDELKSFIINPEFSTEDKEEIILNYLSVFYPTTEILQIPFNAILE